MLKATATSVSDKLATLRVAFGATLLFAFCGIPALRAQNVDTLPHPARFGLSRSASPAPAPFGEPLLQQPHTVPIPSGQPLAPNPLPPVAPISFLSAPHTVAGSTDLYGGYGIYANAYGDFDHKNGLDVVCVQVDGTLNVLLNDGKGNFTRTFILPATNFVNVNVVKAADVNGDGYLDIVGSIGYPSSGFMVWLNNGDGTFAAPTMFSVPAQTAPGDTLYLGGMDVVDENKDGKLDVVISAYQYGFSGGARVSTLYSMTFPGVGDGTFLDPIVGSTQFVGNYMGFRQMTTGDMNGDGIPDMVSALWIQDPATYTYGVYMAVSVGDGTGKFSAFPQPSSGAQIVPASNYAATSLQVLDINGDGKMDVLWTPGLTTFYTSLGNGDATLQPPSPSITGLTTFTTFTTGDYDRDGYTDVALFSDGLTCVYQGLGNGSFSTSPISQYANELAGEQFAVAQDFNGDGIADLVVASPFYNQLAFLKGNGDGTFLAAPLILPANTGSVQPNNQQIADYINVDASGNYFGDGRTGLLVEEGSNNNDYLDFATQNGKNGFLFTRIFNLSHTSGLSGVEPVSGDFNNDGRDDLIFTTPTGIALGLSKGDGTIMHTHTDIAATLNCGLGFAATGDLNHDGNLDIVAVYAGDASCGSPGTTQAGFFVLLGDGTGNFKSTFYAYGTSPYLPRIADLNGDGNLDLVIDDIGAPTLGLSVLPGDGSGTFNPANAKTILAGTSTLPGLLLTDFNGDGIPDITALQTGVYGATDVQQKGIFTMAGNGDFTFKAPTFVYLGITGVTTAYADFNQDKLPDLVVDLGAGNVNVNGLVVFPNLGNGSFGPPIDLQSPFTSRLNIDNTLLTGDFNGDGATDIVLGGGAGFVPSVFYINAAGNQLQLVAESPNTTQFNPVVLSATTNAVGGQTPTGTISFFSNGASIGSAPLVNGISTFSATNLGVGADNITAKYSGDALNYPSASNTAVVTVTALAPDFTLSGTPYQLNVTSAAPGTMTLTLVTNKTFQGPISFACEGLPAGEGCIFSPVQLSLNPNATATINVTVAYSNHASIPAAGFGATAMGGFALAGMLAWFIPAKRVTRQRLRLLAMVLLSMAVLAPLSGCSSNGTKPAFSSNINMIATGVSAGTTITHSSSAVIIVQP